MNVNQLVLGQPWIGPGHEVVGHIHHNIYGVRELSPNPNFPRTVLVLVAFVIYSRVDTRNLYMSILHGT